MARNQPTTPRTQPNQRPIGGLGGLASNRPSFRFTSALLAQAGPGKNEPSKAKPIPVLYPGNADTFKGLSNQDLVNTMAANSAMLMRWGKDKDFIARMTHSVYNTFSYKNKKLIDLPDFAGFSGTKLGWSQSTEPGKGMVKITNMLERGKFTDEGFRSALKGFGATGDLDLLRSSLIQALSPSEVTELKAALALPPTNSFSLPAGPSVKP